MKTKKKSVTTKPVIHYHKDTEEICNSLVKGNAYNTSKGLLVYVARSQSNGKIMFRSPELRQNIYFTKQEWVDGKNDVKNVNSDYVKKSDDESVGKLKDATRALIANKSIFTDVKGDHFSGKEALFLGIDPVNGIRMKYRDSGSTIVYFGSREFKSRFEPVTKSK